jgi:hypothetical protein
MIVGLSGYARSGKDTVADILVEEAGFVRVAFADKLREALYALDPLVSHDKAPDRLLFATRLQTVIDEHGWDGVKNTLYGPEVRRLLQRMGTEVGRNILGENIWVNAAFFGLQPGNNYVFTDCRFQNEATAIRKYQGEIWRVTRPGVEPANDHISEVGLDSWPFNVIILNDDSLESLKEKVLSHARRV